MPYRLQDGATSDCGDWTSCGRIRRAGACGSPGRCGTAEAGGLPVTGPWPRDAVNVLSDKLVFKPQLTPGAGRDVWHPVMGPPRPRSSSFFSTTKVDTKLAIWTLFRSEKMKCVFPLTGRCASRVSPPCLLMVSIHSLASRCETQELLKA